MESITDTIWDVVICGTGLQQSLLALYVFPFLLAPPFTLCATSLFLTDFSPVIVT